MYWKDIELRKQLLHKIHFKDIKDKQELDDTLQKMTENRIFKLRDKTEYRIYMDRDYDDYINDDYPRTTFKYKIKERKLLDWSILQYYDKDMDHQKNYQLERLQSLESLERLQSLERLERKQSINLYNKDYIDLDIPDGDVIYCDPPYGRVKNDDGTMGNKQISEAGYNAFWKKDDDQRLYDYLKLIDKSGSSFMVSGVLRHDDKTCWMLDKLISDGYNYKVLSFD